MINALKPLLAQLTEEDVRKSGWVIEDAHAFRAELERIRLESVTAPHGVPSGSTKAEAPVSKI